VAGAYREPGRYLLMGGLCALLSNAVLIGSDHAGLHYGASVVTAFLVVTPVSYLLHARWTFAVELSWAGFVRFVLGLLSSLLVATVTVGLFRGALGLPMLVAAPLATVTMTAYNFVMARWAIGRRRLL